MKRFSILLALAASSSLLSAQDLIPAILIKDGIGDRVFIETANKKTIRYRATETTVNKTDVSAIGLSVFFFTPPEFENALASYENRNYEQALGQFAAVREKYKKVVTLKGNYSTLAGFYEIECARKLGKYKDIETLFSKFKPEPLVLEAHKTQLKFNSLYNAVLEEDWERLNSLCNQWEEREIFGSLRAQLEYCRGLAQEGLGELKESLLSFNRALIADYGSSEVVVRNAALSCFRVYEQLPEVVEARKLHGTPDESPNSPGAQLLTEASALVGLWDSALSRGAELPAEYREFSKY